MTHYEVNWTALYVPPAPDDHQPPCAEAPYLFDIDSRMAAAVSRHFNNGTRLAEHYAAQLDVALRACATCPLAVRRWCDDATLASGSRASIIAGGKVYTRGRVVWDVERQTRKAAKEAAA